MPRGNLMSAGWTRLPLPDDVATTLVSGEMVVGVLWPVCSNHWLFVICSILGTVCSNHWLFVICSILMFSFDVCFISGTTDLYLWTSLKKSRLVCFIKMSGIWSLLNGHSVELIQYWIHFSKWTFILCYFSVRGDSKICAYWQLNCILPFIVPVVSPHQVGV